MPFAFCSLLSRLRTRYRETKIKPQEASDKKTKTMIQQEHQQLLKIIHEKFAAANRPSNEMVIGNWLSLNGITTHTGADKSYRAIEAYSNSRLSQIKNQLIGIQRPTPLKAFSMGSILHQIILEPELALAEDYVFLTPAPIRHLLAAKKSAMRNRLLKRVLRNEETEVEQVFTWKDAKTKLPCKAKVDIAYEDHRGLYVIDLKSTGAVNKATFLRDCVRYEYGRQAAFYLDGTGAKTVTIYGIQKRAPYGVFRKRYTKRELEQGRRMYGFILGKVLENKKAKLLPGLKT